MALTKEKFKAATLEKFGPRETWTPEIEAKVQTAFKKLLSQQQDEDYLAKPPEYQSALAPPPEPDTPMPTPLGREPVEPEHWPSQVDGKPTLSRDYWMAYTTRSLPYEDRIALENALESGEITLPPGKTLRNPDEEMGWTESITGSVRNQGSQYDDLVFAPEMMGLGDALVSSITDDEGKVQVAEANGMEFRGRDFYGRPLVYSPKSDKTYKIPAGMTVQDVVGTAVTMAPIGKGVQAAKYLTGKVSPFLVQAFSRAPAAQKIISPLGSVGRGISNVEKFLSKPAQTLTGAAAKSGLEQAAWEGVQTTAGDDFDLSNVLTASTFGSLIKLGGKGTEAFLRRKDPDLVRRAKNGDTDALEALKEMVVSDPERANRASIMAGVDMTPQGLRSSLKDKTVSVDDLVLKHEVLPPEEALRIASQPNATQAEKEALARSLQIEMDDEIIKQAEESGLMQYLVSADLVGGSVPKGNLADAMSDMSRVKKIMDSADWSGSRFQLYQELDKKVHDLFKSAGGEDLAVFTKKMKNTMETTGSKLEQEADDAFKKVGEKLGPDVPVDVTDLIAELEKKKKNAKRIMDPGARLAPGEESDPSVFTSFEAEVLSALRPKRSLETVQDPQMLSGDTSFDVSGIAEANYTVLNNLRQRAGSMLKDHTFSSNEKAAADRMYGLLAEAKKATIKRLVDEGKAPASLLKEVTDANQIVISRKALEQDMVELWGRKMGGDLSKTMKSAISGAKSNQPELLAKKIMATPIELRPQLVASSLLHALGDDLRPGKRIAEFGQLANSIKGNKIPTGLIQANLPKGSLKQVQSVSEIGRGIYLATREKLEGSSPAYIEKIIKQKEDILKNVLRLGSESMAASTAIGVANKIPGMGGYGSLPFALGVINLMKRRFTAGDDQAVDNALKLITSPVMKKLISSDLSDKAIEEFSRSVKFDQAAASYFLAGKPSEVEKWVRRAMQSSVTRDSEN